MKPVTKKEAATTAWRPTIAGSHYAASCGHYLATAAAMRALDAGGNAVDAGVTAAIALTVLQPDVVSFAGVLPTLVYMKSENTVVSLEGLGYWPASTDLARLKAEGGDAVPEGILRQIVPAAPATHVEALRRFGTISYEQAATPALQLARDGYYMYPILRDSIELHAAGIDRYAENKSIFRPGGKTPAVGARFKQENLARTIGRMIEAERHAAGDRKAKLRAVHDCFYKGSIAEDIAAFHKTHRGFLTREDLAGFEVPVEKSISTTYNGIEVHACDVWCQGIVLLETLKTLEGIDLRSLGHNTPKYLHVLAQALDLSFSDREAYVGDPKFMKVPTTQLLSAEYAARQRARSSSPVLAVSAKIGTRPANPGSARTRPAASYPLIPGIIRSISTTSYGVAAASRTASAPDSATSTRCPSRRSCVAVTTWLTGISSTSNTRHRRPRGAGTTSFTGTGTETTGTGAGRCRLVTSVQRSNSPPPGTSSRLNSTIPPSGRWRSRGKAPGPCATSAICCATSWSTSISPNSPASADSRSSDASVAPSRGMSSASPFSTAKRRFQCTTRSPASAISTPSPPASNAASSHAPVRWPAAGPRSRPPAPRPGPPAPAARRPAARPAR